MKRCTRCGLENDDQAAQCRGCGAAEFDAAASPGPEASARWVKVAVLAHEIEAERLALELANRNIPHVLKSYHDSALDGLYQLAQGWGQIQAPLEQKTAILAILHDIRQSGAEAGLNAVEESEGDDAPRA